MVRTRAVSSTSFGWQRSGGAELVDGGAGQEAAEVGVSAASCAQERGAGGEVEEVFAFELHGGVAGRVSARLPATLTRTRTEPPGT